MYMYFKPHHPVIFRPRKPLSCPQRPILSFEVLEFLFDYIYNLGKEELESDEDPTQLRSDRGRRFR